MVLGRTRVNVEGAIQRIEIFNGMRETIISFLTWLPYFFGRSNWCSEKFFFMTWTSYHSKIDQSNPKFFFISKNYFSSVLRFFMGSSSFLNRFCFSRRWWNNAMNFEYHVLRKTSHVATWTYSRKPILRFILY